MQEGLVGPTLFDCRYFSCFMYDTPSKNKSCSSRTQNDFVRRRSKFNLTNRFMYLLYIFLVFLFCSTTTKVLSEPFCRAEISATPDRPELGPMQKPRSLSWATIMAAWSTSQHTGRSINNARLHHVFIPTRKEEYKVGGSGCVETNT